MPVITQQDIESAQNSWADGLVEIGRLYQNDQACQEAAQALISTLYNYQEGPVLFKPTRAAEKPFRDTKESALSYLIGDNKHFSEDAGFALEPWKAIRFNNHNIYYHDNMAIAMGEYFFTSLDGAVIKAEYTFGYIKNDQDQLKIVCHHSSLPFNGLG